MKKPLFLTIVFMFLLGAGLTGLTFAQDATEDGPFLVCDPMDDPNVTGFEIEMNDRTIDVEKTEVNATHYKIHYNISDLDPGNYTARARSVNDEWGKHSEWSNEISWTVPTNKEMPSCINFRKE